MSRYEARLFSFLAGTTMSLKNSTGVNLAVEIGSRLKQFAGVAAGGLGWGEVEQQGLNDKPELICCSV